MDLHLTRITPHWMVCRTVNRAFSHRLEMLKQVLVNRRVQNSFCTHQPSPKDTTTARGKCHPGSVGINQVCSQRVSTFFFNCTFVITLARPRMMPVPGHRLAPARCTRVRSRWAQICRHLPATMGSSWRTIYRLRESGDIPYNMKVHLLYLNYCVQNAWYIIYFQSTAAVRGPRTCDRDWSMQTGCYVCSRTGFASEREREPGRVWFKATTRCTASKVNKHRFITFKYFYSASINGNTEGRCPGAFMAVSRTSFAP